MYVVYIWYTNRLTTFQLDSICTNGTNGTNRQGYFDEWRSFTNGAIGEGVLTIGICLCIMDMCALLLNRMLFLISRKDYM